MPSNWNLLIYIRNCRSAELLSTFKHTWTEQFDIATALAQCARASHIQACVMVHSCKVKCRSTWSTSAYSLQRRFSAASRVCQSTTPGSSASPVANVRPTGFLCCWPIGLELIAWQFDRSECHQRQLLQTFENTFVRSVLKHSAH